jgi:hypothetical protein
MATKNRSTFEKFARDRRLQERRERKEEKKLAARMGKRWAALPRARTAWAATRHAAIGTVLHGRVIPGTLAPRRLPAEA